MLWMWFDPSAQGCQKPYNNECLNMNYMLIQIVVMSLTVIATYCAARFYFNKEKDKNIREIYIKYTIYYSMAVTLCSVLYEVFEIATEDDNSLASTTCTLVMMFFLYKQIRPFAELAVRKYKEENGIIIINDDYLERPRIGTDT